MAENKTKPKDKEKIIIIPPLPAYEMDDNNDYIERVCENARRSIIENGWDKEPEEPQNENEDVPTEPEKPQEDLDVTPDDTDDTVLKEECDTAKKPLRKLVMFEKILLAMIALFPLIQIVLFACAPVTAYLIYSAFALVFIVLLSIGMKQYAMLFVEIIILIATGTMLFTGFKHGLTAAAFSKHTMFKISYLNDKTPEYVEFEDMTDEEIISELKGKFIYYYRYGCMDCAAIADSMEVILEENDVEMVPINTRSEFGQRMLASYSVDEVPAAFVIRDDGGYSMHILYTVDDAGNTILDVESLYRVLDKLGIKQEE